MTGQTISWRKFEELTGRKRPPGAVDHTRVDRLALAVAAALARPPVTGAILPRRVPPGKTMAELLRPPRVPRAPLVAANDNHPPARAPLVEERAAGLLSARHWHALGWLAQLLHGEESAATGISAMRMGDTTVPVTSRNPEALFPAELAADRALRVTKLARRLGSLGRIVLAALEGAEMRALAPSGIPLPKRHIAEAGRIRLRAALEIAARMAEAENTGPALIGRDVLDITMRAAADCWQLAATRRLHAANDNILLAMAA